MASKMSSRSNISAAASPKVSATSAKKSSILCSSFAPSGFQLSLFASVIQGFDSQQLRVHDVRTGRLRSEYAAGAGAQINSLDWGYYGSERQSQKSNKKRKRQSNGAAEHYSPEQAVIALGTSDGEIRLFSPSEDKVVAVLKGGHDRAVKQFKFTEGAPSEGWSIGSDGKLVQWDVASQTVSRTISLPNNSVTVLARPTTRSPQIICASSIPYAIDVATGTSQEVTSFDAFRNPIHTLGRSGTNDEQSSETFLAADSDRYMNLYDVQQQRLVKTLVAEFEVEGFTTSDGGEVLAAMTRNGVVQLFKSPFSAASAETSTPNKKSKRRGPSRPDATVRLVRPDKSTTGVPLLSASFDGPDLVFTWSESGVSLAFDRVRWQAEGSNVLAFEGVKDIVRGKSSSLLNSATTNGVHDVGKTYVDDSQAVVTSGGATGNSSADDVQEKVNGEDVDEEEEDDSEDDAAASQLQQIVAEESDSPEDEDEEEEEEEDAEMEDADALDAQDGAEEQEDEEEAEPSFGDMLAEKHPQTIAIASALIPSDPDAVSSLNKDMAIPSGLSLATVLTQSLRTNDQNLLESCLHTTDTNTVRLTIQRLDSSLASTLLQKLADRLARRPGRYGHLLVWVQWVCVAHGGAIAGRPDVLSKIQSLFRVLNQRSRSLDNLLLLKGKLDMLDAQLTLRKQMQSERQARLGAADDSLDGEQEDIIYIEGQDESSSDESSGDEAAASLNKTPKSKSSKSKKNPKSLSSLIANPAGDSSDDEMPDTLPNGTGDSASDSEEDFATPYTSKKSRNTTDILDDEASVSGDSASENSDLEEDEDDDDEEEDSELNDFINDGSEISEVEDDGLLDDDASEEEEEEEITKRPSKKNKTKKI